MDLVIILWLLLGILMSLDHDYSGWPTTVWVVIGFLLAILRFITWMRARKTRSIL